ncbi:cell division protein FtsA [Cytobacillus purgationiresistens]|uniref:Cell division protein FtsA n=1 Tax=Cytobacillus purgationiresistens TaxID=863449 RepID=A0ABU0AP20_9BACI|nr:cell division protein FtsA [Cytobacillus purgationiresistens]MDQ0272148.1 cell division protein FtsA [Cytobacillus purgationiresistens]
MNQPKKIFALDIGTRSVVGIILEKNHEQFNVIDILAQEHSERAMLDGQIHDIVAVSRVISNIKEKLEEKHGPLKKVSVAAAGRALKTERASASIDISGKPLMSKQDILHLELSAVQQAQASVAEKNAIEKSNHYYCVGYSILFFHLDGQEIGNLIDQKGKEASVDIITTFLPKIVIESLIAALHRSGLEMEALTLEPIAAINVLIPPSMRKLNVALVDIGAGTSDIAITDLGTVVAYGMVPIAGDEITEAVQQCLLLDFPLAEQAKKDLNTKDYITVADILGFETELPKEEIISDISPALDRLTTAICEEILSLNNQRAPKAVMLVGGGSQTPELTKRIAATLQLPENRVAIRGIDAIQSLSISESVSTGPELVTPIGIAIAAHKSPVQYRTVYVNEQPLRLFEINKLTVGDCLLAAGIKISKLYGKPGLAMIISLNGNNITIPGSHGTSPTLTLDKQICQLDDEVKNGDHLAVIKGKDGKKAEVRIKDLVDEVAMRQVQINGKSYTITASVIQNGQQSSMESLIEDRDKILCKIPSTIEDLFRFLKLDSFLNDLKPLKIILNNKETVIPPAAGKLFRNGNEIKTHFPFEHLDQFSIQKKEPLTIRLLAHYKQLPYIKTMFVTYNGQSLQLTKTISIFKREREILKEYDSINEGDHITYEQTINAPFIFQDIFKHIKVDIPHGSSGRFTLLKNGEESNFHDQIKDGDVLEIVWPIKKVVITKNKKTSS